MGIGDMAQNITGTLITILWLVGAGLIAFCAFSVWSAFKSINAGMWAFMALASFFLSMLIFNFAQQATKDSEANNSNACVEILGEEVC